VSVFFETLLKDKTEKLIIRMIAQDLDDEEIIERLLAEPAK